MSVVKMEVESVLVNPVDTALQLMTVESGVNNNPIKQIIAIKCEQKTHIPTHGGKGLFFVRGSRLLTASNKVLTENSVAFLGQTDCGYEGCVHSCVDSLQEQLHKLSEYVPFSNKSWAHNVVLEEGGNAHPEVCSEDPGTELVQDSAQGPAREVQKYLQ